MIRLVADSGSTKTDWALISVDAPEICFSTLGLNPSLMPDNQIREILRMEVKSILGDVRPDEVFFYGAGCRKTIAPLVEYALCDELKCKKAIVDTDMLGAARALCGNEPGVACILGTGSNSCVYDGNAIADNISPLGYILGDEGSGVSIGKRFISDLFKRQYPKTVHEIFSNDYGYSLDDVIQRVYRTPDANRFLASFAPFVKKCVYIPEVEEMVIEEFCRFIKRNVAGYEELKILPVNFVGSIAANFSSQLEKAMDICGYKIGKIKQRPIEGIIEYHKQQP